MAILESDDLQRTEYKDFKKKFDVDSFNTKDYGDDWKPLEI